MSSPPAQSRLVSPTLRASIPCDQSRFASRAKAAAKPSKGSKAGKSSTDRAPQLTVSSLSKHHDLSLRTVKALGAQNPRRLLASPKEEIKLDRLADVKESCDQDRSNGGKLVYNASLIVNWHAKDWEPISAHGQDSREKFARKAAWYHVLAQLKERGHLAEVFKSLQKLKVVTLGKAERAAEKTAFIDVYNYCVRYGHLPEVTRARMAKKGSSTTTIALPAHNIRVEANGNDADADIAASIRFKQQVEAYHKEQGTDSLVVKAHDTINTSNTDEFFSFYKLKYPGQGRWVVEVQDVGAGVFAAHVIFANGKIGPSIQAYGKKMAETLAMLAYAHTVCQNDPAFKEDFLVALKEGNGSILMPVAPMDLPIDDTAVLLMRDTLAKARQNGLPDKYQELEAEQTNDTELLLDPILPSEEHLRRCSDILKEAKQRYEQSESMAKLRDARSGLPMVQYSSEVLELVTNNLFSIIIGETGSGKTTQVPQILIDHFIDQGIGSSCNVICTQPRRIAATSVARRVAAERGEALRTSVGFQVRGDSQRATKPGSINFCTTGILLARLQTDPDQVLDRVSHIILDEVHERDKFLDYTLIILKQVIAQRIADKKTCPKIVLMSATLDPALFAPYFGNVQPDGSATDAPTLRVPGRTFPVTEKYLGTVYNEIKSSERDFLTYIEGDRLTQDYLAAENDFSRTNPISDVQDDLVASGSTPRGIIDWKRTASAAEESTNSAQTNKLFPTRLVASTIAHIVKNTADGAILVFVPGWDEISLVQKELQNSKQPIFGLDFNDLEKYSIFTLHSSIGESQVSVFDPVPAGKRKIILSTNIAETSVTIPDVQYVVDTGKARETMYDPERRITSLVPTWVSKSNTKQRAGRAGRVQNGHYYALYSKSRAQSLRAVGLPELLRSDLAETCLDVVAQKWPVPPQEFLAAAIEPPDPVEVEQSIQTLVAIGALTTDEKLTPLGRLLSTLPIHPELGKMVVMGIIFKCLDPMIILGAAHGSKSLFTMAIGKEARDQLDSTKKHYAASTRSDHIALLNAFRELRTIHRSQGLGAARDHAYRNQLHWGAYKSIEATATAIEAALMEARLIPVFSPQDRVHDQYGDANLNFHSRKNYVIKAIAASGLYPRLAVKANANHVFWRSQKEAEVLPHPSSVNAQPRGRQVPQVVPSSPSLAVFSELSRGVGDELYFRNCSFVSPLAVSLFCGRTEVDAGRNPRGSSSSRLITVDRWMPFYVQCDDRLAVRTLVETRKALERMLVRAFADLSKRELLAADPVRAIFADGLVDVLSLDVCPDGREASKPAIADTNASQGWDRLKENLYIKRLASYSQLGSLASPPSGRATSSKGPTRTASARNAILSDLGKQKTNKKLEMFNMVAEWENTAKQGRKLNTVNTNMVR